MELAYALMWALGRHRRAAPRHAAPRGAGSAAPAAALELTGALNNHLRFDCLTGVGLIPGRGRNSSVQVQRCLPDHSVCSQAAAVHAVRRSQQRYLAVEVGCNDTERSPVM